MCDIRNPRLDIHRQDSRESYDLLCTTDNPGKTIIQFSVVSQWTESSDYSKILEFKQF